LDGRIAERARARNARAADGLSSTITGRNNGHAPAGNAAGAGVTLSPRAFESV